MVEDGGVSSKSGIVKSNQWSRNNCERSDCVICYQKDGKSVKKCMKNNVDYEAKCTRCPTRFSYIGETSRTGYTRTKEHISDYRAAAAAELPPLPPTAGVPAEGRKKNVKSFMWEHCRDFHGDQ